MPKWIHDRADHIRAKNPDMSESEAWAIATQQSHALGKSPEGYGTLGGRATAKAKFNTPKDDVKSANPGQLTPKVAATLDALQQAYKRIGPLRNKIKPSARVVEHVMESPTPAAMGIREMSALGGPGTLPRPAQMGMLRQRPAIMAENTRALGGTPEQVASMIEQGNAQVEGTRQYIGNAGGAILMPPGGMSGWTARANASGASPIVPPEGAAQQRAANILTGVHEGYERSTRSSPSPYFSHFSPSVMHKEHNMVAGLEGPGAQEGRQYFQGIRASGEGPAHAEQLRVMYGDKAAPYATYGQGPKIPKAMRKDMIRNWPQYQEHERGKLRSLVEKGQQEVAPGGISFEEGKVAASAPTRGNFMMASDIPSFRAPQLGAAIQKDGAFEDTKKGTEKDSDSIGLTTYSPGDFRQVNINAKHAGYFKLEGDAVIETDKHGKSLGKGPVTKEAMLSMSTEKLAEFVAELREMRKEAIAGLTPASQLEKTTLVGAPKASRTSWPKHRRSGEATRSEVRHRPPGCVQNGHRLRDKDFEGTCP